MKKEKQINSNNQLTPLETALQQQFKPDANSVKKAFDAVENHRLAFASGAIQFGLCALTAKAVVGHGKFTDWLKSALSENGNVQIGAVDTAREYIWFANAFIDKLRDPKKLTGSLDIGVEDFCAVSKIERKDFDIVSILANTNLTKDLLYFTVRGMSLRKLRQLLREGAEQAYADEQRENATALTKSDLRGLKGGVDESGQANFFDELFDEVRATVEVKFDNDNRILTLSKDQLLELGNYLKDRAAKILSLAKEKKD